MAKIPPELIDEILYKNPIEDVISQYVSLKKNGSRYVGLCPFHNEKTPSFVVYPNTKSFYCFGCGAGGTAATFLSKIENLTYRESLEALAGRVGIALPEDDGYYQRDKNVPSKKRVLEMNLAAAKFFRYCLFDPKLGRAGMAYLRGKRALDEATIKHFGLGFAPNDFYALTNHMRSLGYNEEELQYAFLCGKSQKSTAKNSYYDYFRNRVIFPIIDTAGSVIGFGGRVMDDSKPKYLNTSDTAAFKKSRNLFALNYAKNHAEDYLILCEGYMDVIALHAAGYESAIATLGTALTDEQARIISRYTKRVLICYDSDEAGQKAAFRASSILTEAGLDVRVLKMEGAKDPDEYIRKNGAPRFQGVINGSLTEFSYRTDIIKRKYNFDNPEEKIRAAGEICALIATYPSGVARELYIADAAKEFSLSAEVLRADVEKSRSYRSRKAREELKKEADRSVMMLGDTVNREASANPRAVKAEEAVLGVLMYNEKCREYIAANPEILTVETFFSSFSKELFERIMALHSSDSGFELPLLEEDYSAEAFSRIYAIYHRRAQLENNDLGVMLEAIDSLRRETDTAEDPILSARKRLGIN